jgi:hypothetical protein
MVAKDVLEVRVAMRVHQETGAPIGFSNIEDGYVHEKWAIFNDGAGNRIFISGSLNESKTALVHNAENIDLQADWWEGMERRSLEDAQAAFDALWNNKSPYTRVLSLPEAVRQRFVQIR